MKRRFTRSSFVTLLIFMLLMAFALPSFAADPTGSITLPTPTEVTSITVGGATAYYQQDDNGPDKFIRAIVPTTAHGLKDTTVVINLVNSATTVTSPNLTFTGGGTTTRTATGVDLLNKAYQVNIGGTNYILAAGLPNGVVAIDSSDPLKIAPVVLEGENAVVEGFNVQNPYMGNDSYSEWTFINYYVTATLPASTPLNNFNGTMSLAGGASVTGGCATSTGGANYNFNVSTTNEFVVTNGSDNRTYHVAVGVAGDTFVITASDYTIDFQELKLSVYYTGDIVDQVAEIEDALIEYYAEGPYTFASGTTVMEILEDFVAFAYDEELFSWNTDITYGGAYLSRLNGLAEFDGGALSGWMYTDLPGGWTPTCSVPMVGAASYTLNGGETITWFYTVDYFNHF